MVDSAHTVVLPVLHFDIFLDDKLSVKNRYLRPPVAYYFQAALSKADVARFAERAGSLVNHDHQLNNHACVYKNYVITVQSSTSSPR